MPKGCVRPLTTVDGEMGVGTPGRRRLRIDVASRHESFRPSHTGRECQAKPDCDGDAVFTRRDSGAACDMGSGYF
jgi:hypothetical protein